MINSRQLVLLLILLSLLIQARATFSTQFYANDNSNNDPRLEQRQQQQHQLHLGQPQPGQLFVVKNVNNNGTASEHVKLIPEGLLDSTLLNRGSFRFGSKVVRFDKLKVLGNVYVNNVNGKPLRELYLFKKLSNNNNNNNKQQPQQNSINKRDEASRSRSSAAAANKEAEQLDVVKLQVL